MKGKKTVFEFLNNKAAKMFKNHQLKCREWLMTCAICRNQTSQKANSYKTLNLEKILNCDKYWDIGFLKDFVSAFIYLLYTRKASSFVLFADTYAEFVQNSLCKISLKSWLYSTVKCSPPWSRPGRKCCRRVGWRLASCRPGNPPDVRSGTGSHTLPDPECY